MFNKVCWTHLWYKFVVTIEIFIYTTSRAYVELLIGRYYLGYNIREKPFVYTQQSGRDRWTVYWSRELGLGLLLLTCQGWPWTSYCISGPSLDLPTKGPDFFQLLRCSAILFHFWKYYHSFLGYFWMCMGFVT